MSQYHKPGQGGYGMGTRVSVPPRTGATRGRPAAQSGAGDTAGKTSIPSGTRSAQPMHPYGGRRSYGDSSETGRPRAPGGKGKGLIVSLVLLTAVVLVVCLLLSGRSQTQPEDTLPVVMQTTVAVSSTFAPESTNKVVQPEAELFQLYSPELRWYMQQLTEHEKTLFAILYDHLASVEKTITVPARTYTVEEFERTLTVLRNDCPELVHFKGQTSVSYTSRDGYLLSATFEYLHDSIENNLALTRQVLDEVGTLISLDERTTDDLNIEHRLYRGVIERATYDKEFGFCANADAVFLHGRAKGTGYASAFNLACRMYDIPCIYVTGNATNDESTEAHAWNYVWIDGNWYVCDPTWDSAFAESCREYPKPISKFLNYFNLTQEQIGVSHVLDSEYAQYGWILPECTAEEASFWNAFGGAELVTVDNWQNVLVEQLKRAAQGEQQVIVLRTEDQKVYDKIRLDFEIYVDEWMERSSNYGSYRYRTFDSAHLIVIDGFHWREDNSYRSDGLKVYFFDVGDADATLVDCEGHYMIIDGGTEKSGSSQLYSFLQSNGITYVDALIVTHPHSDHAGGLCGALAYEKCSFGTFYSSVLASDNKSFNTLLEKAAQRGLQPVVPDRGMQFRLGSAVVTFLSPEAHKSYENVNNKSLVVRVDYGQNSFLFTGDIMENAEKDLLASGMNLEADVLKVAHHGAASSSSLNFLQAVSPSVAIISCGANLQEHPGSETLERLSQTAGMVLRTDKHGEVVLFSDGKKITYSMQK